MINRTIQHKDGVRFTTSYTDLQVSGTLRNGRQFWYGWTTPCGIHAARGRAYRYLQEALKDNGVPGRTRIETMTVVTTRVEGNWYADET